MKLFSLITISLLTVAMVLPAVAQERVALSPSNTAQTAPGNLSQGQAAIQSAAASNKYLFILFWKDKNAQTDKAWNTLRTGAAKFADSADIVAIQTTDPAERAIGDRFNISGAPMPMVLAIAPCGAVTKAFMKDFDEKQLAAAFVSPCEQLCMKAIQNRKMVFVCVSYEVSSDGQATIPQGVMDFQADKKYANTAEIVPLHATDKNEADFLKELKIDTQTREPVYVLLAARRHDWHVRLCRDQAANHRQNNGGFELRP